MKNNQSNQVNKHNTHNRESDQLDNEIDYLTQELIKKLEIREARDSVKKQQQSHLANLLTDTTSGKVLIGKVIQTIHHFISLFKRSFLHTLW